MKDFKTIKNKIFSEYCNEFPSTHGFREIEFEDWLIKKLIDEREYREVNYDKLIAFGVWLSGHDKQTIEQMFNDFTKKKNSHERTK